MSVRIIGDVHGLNCQYITLLHYASGGCTHSIQLGDMDLRYDWMSSHVDPNNHRFVPGNHDNYNCLPQHAYQQSFDMEVLNGLHFMYVRGAYSIDKDYRVPGVSWWPEEEIGWEDGLHAIQSAREAKPSVILSHDCPFSLYDYLVYGKSQPSRTSQILQAIFEEHQPELWVFGHHHVDTRLSVNGTEFICLNELSYIDYPDLTIQPSFHS